MVTAARDGAHDWAPSEFGLACTRCRHYRATAAPGCPGVPLWYIVERLTGEHPPIELLIDQDPPHTSTATCQCRWCVQQRERSA